MKKIIRIGFILLLLAFFAGGTAYYFIYLIEDVPFDIIIIYVIHTVILVTLRIIF